MQDCIRFPASNSNQQVTAVLTPTRTVSRSNTMVSATWAVQAEYPGDESGAVPFLKRFTVFNTDQCENLPDELVTAPPVPEGLILPQADALIAATGADFRIGGDTARRSRARSLSGDMWDLTSPARAPLCRSWRSVRAVVARRRAWAG